MLTKEQNKLEMYHLCNKHFENSGSWQEVITYQLVSKRTYQLGSKRTYQLGSRHREEDCQVVCEVAFCG